MIAQRDHFFTRRPSPPSEEIGICGKYISSRGSIHVGIFCRNENNNQVMHYTNANTVKIEPISSPSLSEYYFQTVNFFHSDFIDSLCALCEEIAAHNLNNMQITISDSGVIYKGARFSSGDGKLQITDDTENYINCGIFVVMIFASYNSEIIDWKNWEPVDAANRHSYLEDWLNAQNIPDTERADYYKTNINVRGKHVFSVPLTSIPASQDELERIANIILPKMEIRENPMQV